MKDNKGITLIMAIMTVLLLAIIAGVSITVGVNTYRNAQIVEFETIMSIIQKKVDIIVEEGEDISKYGATPQSIQYGFFVSRVLIQENSKYIHTTAEDIVDNVRKDKKTIRYFKAATMKDVFGIETDSQFLINFETREVINISGVQIGGETFFVLNGLHEALEGND